MSSISLIQKQMSIALLFLILSSCTPRTAITIPATQPPILAPFTSISTPTPLPSGACPKGDSSILGILRSIDHGATWMYVGQACMQRLTIGPVDPTGFVIDGRVVLYFVDIKSLDKPVDQIIYRATSGDGMNFDNPQPVYKQDVKMVDPVALLMSDGTFRIYVPSDDNNTIRLISLVSDDGLSFRREDGFRNATGGMPAGLILSDSRLRLFVHGSMQDGGPEGIYSYISSDYLNFTLEDGMRLIAPDGFIIGNPQPIRLSDGRYLLLYLFQERITSDQIDPWTFQEMHIATSNNGFDWIPGSSSLGNGSTSCIVEMPDGTLYVYYVNGNP